MVRKNNRLGRAAFTMIELIFAIVIIGISVVSLPMMSVATSKGLSDSIVQEAIFAASAELMGASAGYWDVNSMQDSAFSDLSRVLDLAGDCDNDKLRPGHIAQPLHRRCLDNNATGVLNASSVAFPNLNNAVVGEVEIFVNPSADKTGYKEIYTSEITMGNVGPSGNIKDIVSTIRDEDGNTIVVLIMQSANIGEVDYFSRSF